MMTIHKISMLTGKAHKMDLPVTQEQFEKFLAGTMVQDAFPHLSPAQREFILSGITPEEWDEQLGPEDED